MSSKVMKSKIMPNKLRAPHNCEIRFPRFHFWNLQTRKQKIPSHINYCLQKLEEFLHWKWSQKKLSRDGNEEINSITVPLLYSNLFGIVNDLITLHYETFRHTLLLWNERKWFKKSWSWSATWKPKYYACKSKKFVFD